MLGMKSDTPFKGINLVVKKYIDGSVVKKKRKF